ncbi:MAG: single-stranded DNA-binding protein [Nitrospirota bacterium]|jgi:single-strand DNA-binding protein
MFNKVILIGNLTKDPELRYTPSGTPVTTMRLAVTTKFKQGDEFKEETLFIDVVVFGRQAETCSQYLSKGRPVLTEGRLQERRWESDGQQRSKMEVVAQNVRFLGGGGGGRRDEGGGPSQEHQGSPPQESTDVEPF